METFLSLLSGCTTCGCAQEKKDKAQGASYAEWKKRVDSRSESAPWAIRVENDLELETQFSRHSTRRGSDRGSIGAEAAHTDGRGIQQIIGNESTNSVPSGLGRRGSLIKRMMGIGSTNDNLSPGASDAPLSGRRKSFMDRGTSSKLSEPASPTQSPNLRRRASWVQRITGSGSREVSPEPQAAIPSPEPKTSTDGEKVASSRGRRGSWIQRLTGKSPEPVYREPYKGEQAQALFYHHSPNDNPVFPPDPRSELTIRPGMKLDLIDMRTDGWCIVRKYPNPTEYYVPGNMITVDGHTPYYGTPTPSNQGKGYRRRSQTNFL